MGRAITSAGLCLVALTAGELQATEWLDRDGVVDFLEGVQVKSLEADREFCGYFVRVEERIVATPPQPGSHYECLSAEPSGDVEVIASYHSHGAFDVNADSEVPSVDDILGDREEEVDGYIVTPGGRVWFHDLESGRVVLICGPKCVISDPEHSDDVFEPIATRYTLEGLRLRFEGER